MMNNAVAHQASIPHLAMLSNNNWDNHNHNHSISNLGAQKDSTGAKNAQGTDHLAKNFGVPPEDAQKYLAKIESEEGNEYPDSPFAKFAEMENSEWNKVNGEHKEGIKRVKVSGLNPNKNNFVSCDIQAKAGAIDYPKQGTAARRIKVTWPSLVRLRWGKQKKAQRKRKRTSSYFELRK
jgi:hypothetical protein